MLIRKFILRIIYLLCGLRTVVTRDLPGSRDNVIIGAKTSENKPDERGGNNCIGMTNQTGIEHKCISCIHA